MSGSPITSAEMDAFLDSGGFPEVYATKGNKRLPLDSVISGYGPLDATHLAALNAHLESGSPLDVPVPFNTTVKALRHTHHRLAQLLAGGMNETIAAKLCNYTPQRVSHIKSDPAFVQLLDHYKGQVDDEFADFVTAAAALNMDFMGRLQQMLDEDPEKFGPGHLMDAIKLLADRTGHAPVTKSVNINVNTDMAQRLRNAQNRLRNVTPGGVLPDGT